MAAVDFTVAAVVVVDSMEAGEAATVRRDIVRNRGLGVKDCIVRSYCIATFEIIATTGGQELQLAIDPTRDRVITPDLSSNLCFRPPPSA
jgi:hypothetical protein